MKYTVQYSEKAVKQLNKLDKHTRKLILSWIGKNLEGSLEPRVFGKGLTANKSGKWRYRIGDYRVICNIKDEELIILTLEVGHKRDIYKR